MAWKGGTFGKRGSHKSGTTVLVTQQRPLLTIVRDLEYFDSLLTRGILGPVTLRELDARMGMTGELVPADPARLTLLRRSHVKVDTELIELVGRIMDIGYSYTDIFNAAHGARPKSVSQVPPSAQVYMVRHPGLGWQECRQRSLMKETKPAFKTVDVSCAAWFSMASVEHIMSRAAQRAADINPLEHFRALCSGRFDYVGEDARVLRQYTLHRSARFEKRGPVAPGEPDRVLARIRFGAVTPNSSGRIEVYDVQNARTFYSGVQTTWHHDSPTALVVSNCMPITVVDGMLDISHTGVVIDGQPTVHAMFHMEDFDAFEATAEQTVALKSRSLFDGLPLGHVVWPDGTASRFASHQSERTTAWGAELDMTLPLGVVRREIDGILGENPIISRSAVESVEEAFSRAEFLEGSRIETEDGTLREVGVGRGKVHPLRVIHRMLVSLLYVRGPTKGCLAYGKTRETGSTRSNALRMAYLPPKPFHPYVEGHGVDLTRAVMAVVSPSAAMVQHFLHLGDVSDSVDLGENIFFGDFVDLFGDPAILPAMPDLLGVAPYLPVRVDASVADSLVVGTMNGVYSYHQILVEMERILHANRTPLGWMVCDLGSFAMALMKGGVVKVMYHTPVTASSVVGAHARYGLDKTNRGVLSTVNHMPTLWLDAFEAGTRLRPELWCLAPETRASYRA